VYDHLTLPLRRQIHTEQSGPRLAWTFEQSPDVDFLLVYGRQETDINFRGPWSGPEYVEWDPVKVKKHQELFDSL
jgi:hypothetical protein